MQYIAVRRDQAWVEFVWREGSHGGKLHTLETRMSPCRKAAMLWTKASKGWREVEAAPPFSALHMRKKEMA